MLNEKIGLVLEGGGMRGAYTSGALEAFMEENIRFSYVIGVSAGASNGANFVAEQKKRGEKVFVEYVGHKEYSGFKYWLKDESYFNMDFLFGVLPNKLAPFDYETFMNSETVFKVCATNAQTGRAEYFKKSDYTDKDFIARILKASSSLPIISTPVEIDNQLYFDGGISDSIPIERSIEDGNKYNVLLLTRDKDYRKRRQLLGLYSKYYLKKYPKVLDALEKRHIMYNSTLEKIEDLERDGSVFVFRPMEEIKVGRLEKDTDKLRQLYKQGYRETKDQMKSFKEWIQGLKS